MRRIGLSCLFLLLIVCVVSFALQPEKPIKQTALINDKHPSESQNKPSRNKNKVIQEPLVMQSGDNPVPPQTTQPIKQHITQNEEYGSEGWRNFYKRPMTVFTFALAIATILLVWAGRKQLRIAKETSANQLRAYVFPGPISIFNVAGERPNTINPNTMLGPWLFDRGGGPFIHMNIKNTGQTPAFNVRHAGAFIIGDYPGPVAFPTLDISAGPAGVSIIPSGATTGMRLGIRNPLTIQQIKGLEEGRLALYLYGRIRYEDSFRKPHQTNYRLMYNGLVGIVGLEESMIYCEDGNNAN